MTAVLERTRTKLNQMTIVDQQALALFDGESTADYKRMVVYLVYKTIEKNPNITVKAIKWILRRYDIAKDLVEKAVKVLMSKELFNAIHFWNSTQQKGVKLYKINPDNKLMEKWVSSIDAARPELQQFNVEKPSK